MLLITMFLVEQVHSPAIEILMSHKGRIAGRMNDPSRSKLRLV